MKIVLCGKNRIAIESLRILKSFAAEDEIYLVTCSADMSAPEVFGDFFAAATASGLVHYDITGATPAKSLEKILGEWNPDLILSSQFSVIFSQAVCHRFYGKILNVHNSYLPFYRGVAPISHAINNGETEHGVTLHLIDQGIDTGPIIDQEKFYLKNLTNYEAYEQCNRAGVLLLERNMEKILREIRTEKSLVSLSIPQDHQKATYYPRGSFDYSQRKLHFNQTSHQLTLKVLAFTFPPLLSPVCEVEGREFDVESCEPLFSLGLRFEKPGTVLMRDESSVVISTRDIPVRLRLRS